MADTTLPGVLLHGTAAARPAANAVAKGTIYSATDTGAITQSDGVSTWSTWATIAAAGMTNPMSAVGDIIQGTTAGAPAALAAPLAGKVLTGAGVTTPMVYAYPPGYEFDHVQFTSSVAISANTEGTANTIVTSNAVTYDGSTIVIIHFFASDAYSAATATVDLIFVLYDGASSIGLFGVLRSQSTSRGLAPIKLERRLTPSNASHTYSVRGYIGSGGGSAEAGVGGSGFNVPGFIRITKV